MILFYSKITGDIFAAQDGRVHGEMHLNSFANDGVLTNEQIGRYIIGWIEKDGQKIAYNEDKFPLMQEFESVTPTSPLDFKVDLETGELVKKEGLAK